ncbi:MAG: hypothetical protein WBG65_12895, partial [Sulfurimonadaceae bacterium]
SETPNACNNCHKDQSAQWATKAMKQWYGEIPLGHQNFSHALDALHTNDRQAQTLLYKVLMSDAPHIAKATVIGYLGNYPSKQSYMTILQMLRNSDDQVRLNALRALESFPPQHRVSKTFELITDKTKTVRMEAARQLSSLPQGDLDPQTRSMLNIAIEEYRETLLFNADRAESQNALALLYMNLQALSKAEEAFNEALRIEPMFIPTYINYAHFYQRQQQEKKAYAVLQQGLKLHAQSADLWHSLGLWYVRNAAKEKGVEALKKAATLSPDNARYQYVYAVALADKDQKQAIKVLENSLQKHSGDIDTLSALSYFYNQLGDKTKADYYQNEIQEVQSLKKLLNR